MYGRPSAFAKFAATAGRDAAVQAMIEALERNGGSVKKAAAEFGWFGYYPRWYEWRDMLHAKEEIAAAIKRIKSEQKRDQISNAVALLLGEQKDARRTRRVLPRTHR